MLIDNTNPLGARLPDNYVTDVFYGLKLNNATGRLTVDEIGGNNGTIKLPDTTIVRNDDYEAWIFSGGILQFSFNPLNGHLLMTAL